MTETPERKQNQTWANYFLERLREKGADTNLHDFCLKPSPIAAANYVGQSDELIYGCTISRQPEVMLELNYALDMYDQNIITPHDHSLTIKVDDPESGDSCFLVVGPDHGCKDHVDIIGLDGQGLEDLLPDGITPTRALCNLADYVKERQDHYKRQESEQK